MSAIGGDPGPAIDSRELSQDERAELEQLRGQVTELRVQQARQARRRRIRWRTPVAVVLIMLGCVLAPVSVLAVWTANQVSDTGRYVANVAPLIHEPSVQNALTDKVTNEITSNLNITGYVNDAATLLAQKGLPRVGTLLQTFGPSLASAVTGYVHNTVHKIVASHQFANTWIQVNTTAHQAVVSALSGQKGAVGVSNGQVTIDLTPFINIVKQALVARGFTLVNRLPQIHPTLALFSARELTKSQSGYRLLNDLKIVLPILALVLIAAGVYIAPGHRRALIGPASASPRPCWSSPSAC